MELNDDTILIRYAYAENITPEKRYDGKYMDKTIKNEILHHSETKCLILTNVPLGDKYYKISLVEKIFDLNSEENSPVKKMSPKVYLNHYDEDGPIRGFIILDLQSKYKDIEKNNFELSGLNNATTNIITTFNQKSGFPEEQRQKQKFIFTKYKNIRLSAELQDIEIEMIYPNEDDELRYIDNKLQIAHLGQLMSPDKRNNAEVNFIGKLQFSVFELEIFDMNRNLQTEQKLYDECLN